MGIEARGWGVRLPGRRAWALRGLDLRIEPGERVLLVGRSGAGKSTLLTALAGLLDSATTETQGSLLVGGGLPREAAAGTGLLLQDPESQLVMGRAGDDVAFGLENLCLPTAEIPARVAEALEAVDFPYPPEHSTHALSGGEQQRLALAGTLALRPGLLLLDEPTANLDPEGAARVRAVLTRELGERLSTLVLVEHDVEPWLPLIDRVVTLTPEGVVGDSPPSRFRGEALPAPLRTPGAATGEPLLVAEAAAFRYPGSSDDAVGPVDVELRSSEALAIVGPNGSGKSTLALILGGLIAPRSGRVIATQLLAPGGRQQVVAEWPARRLARHIGSVFQDPEHQFLTGSVREELMLGPLRAGMSAARAATGAHELLERLALSHLAAANPFTLSGGEKRRLSVGTALAATPRLLILDEPTFGQDDAGRAELRNLLAALRDEGHGICFVTHDERFVRALADRTMTLGRGA